MKAPLDHWKAMRQRARTDLGWLCKNVLGYKDVCEVHIPIIQALQQFYGGEEPKDTINLKDGCGYKPFVPMWELKSDFSPQRKTVIMFPRGHLKTSIDIAHTIQWIVNYPDVRILLSSGTGDQVRGFLRETKEHFQFNENFRALFPEFCPQGKAVKEFGNQDMFTVPCRTRHPKEPTVSTCTIGSVIAGGHYDVVKHDDLVDKENVRTPEQIETVKQHFAMMTPLVETSKLEPYHGWIDLIGTIYHFADLHFSLIRAEEEKPPSERQWAIVKQSACPNYPEGPTIWPDRVPLEYLKSIETDPSQGPEILYSQYLLNPRPSKSGLVDSKDDIVWVPRKVIRELYASMRLHLTIDLAGMEPASKTSDNDYTVLNLHGFGRDGTLYVVHLFHGRYTPLEVINILFQLLRDHPRIFDMKIEKDAHARVLLAFLEQEQMKRGIFLPLVPIQRDNRTSKQQRIKGLQPWFAQRKIAFAADLPCKRQIEDEILFFPKYSHDDILDTCADAMQNRDGGITQDVIALPNARIPLGQEPKARFVGFGPEGKELWAHGLMNYQDEETQTIAAGYDPMTGY